MITPSLMFSTGKLFLVSININSYCKFASAIRLFRALLRN